MGTHDILERLACTTLLICGRKKDGCRRAKPLFLRGTKMIMPPRQALSILGKEGWRLNTNPDLDRCPDCIKAGYGIDEEPWFPKQASVAAQAVKHPIYGMLDQLKQPRIHDLFDQLNEFGSLDWRTDENMFLAAIGMMIVHVERFITDHYANVSPLNQVALLESAQSLMKTLGDRAGLGPLIETKDKEIADLKAQTLRLGTKVAEQRVEIAALVKETNELKHKEGSQRVALALAESLLLAARSPSPPIQAESSNAALRWLESLT